MKTNLQFFDFVTGAPSDCGAVLEIEFSSAGLDWSGIILEQGSSPHFYPNKVYTPYFYFALAQDEDLHWNDTDLQSPFYQFSFYDQEAMVHR